MGTVVNRFEVQTGEIAQDLEVLNKNMGSYDERLTNYQSEFSAIVELIARTTREINSRVESLAPVFQLHDMTLQQIHHLSQVERQLLDDVPVEARAARESDVKHVRQTVLTHAHKAATTDDELAVVNRLAKLYGLELETSAATGTKIELF